MNTEIERLLLESEDSSSVAAMSSAVEAAIPAVTTMIGMLMLEGKDTEAADLRDHAQQFAAVSALLDRLYDALETSNG